MKGNEKLSNEELRLYLVTDKDGKPFCAYPTKVQSQVYAYGFSHNDANIIEGVFVEISRLDRGERAIEAMGRIADIVNNYSCHSAAEAYARITEIVMEYEKEGEK
jgi:hypothetical protein